MESLRFYVNKLQNYELDEMQAAKLQLKLLIATLAMSIYQGCIKKDLFFFSKEVDFRICSIIYMVSIFIVLRKSILIQKVFYFPRKARLTTLNWISLVPVYFSLSWLIGFISKLISYETYRNLIPDLPRYSSVFTSFEKSNLALEFINTCILAPMEEEYGYRLLMLGLLIGVFKFIRNFFELEISAVTRMAIVLGSVLLISLAFSSDHGTFDQVVQTFYSGILYGLSYIFSGSILVPLLFHILNNARADVFSYIYTFGADEYHGLVTSTSDYISVLGFAIIIYYIFMKWPKIYKNSIDKLSHF